MRILVVEDERKVASFIRQGLEEEGHAVEVAGDGAAALEAARRRRPSTSSCSTSCCPKRDGFDVLKTLRAAKVRTPVLMSDRARRRGGQGGRARRRRGRLPHQAVRVRGAPRARARAAAPRDEPAGARADVADLTLDPATREARAAAGAIALTAREYALLEYFLRNTGRVLTRPMIAEHVWGLDFDPESNIVDVYVGYLRRKVDATARPRSCTRSAAPATSGRRGA